MPQRPVQRGAIPAFEKQLHTIAARFPGKVAVWHSALSPGERYDTWERVRSGELSMVVGPRSALFAPVKNLGVIIVDEEHEPVYKQRDRTPIFHAREAAIELRDQQKDCEGNANWKIDEESPLSGS